MCIQKTLASFIAVVTLATANATAHAAATHRFTDKDRQEVKDIVLRQAAAATAHEIVRIPRLLESDGGISPDDVFDALAPVPNENFSFGRGIAQFADAAPTW
ncbi:hypothetical protein RA280_09980 [Cupriavidus sp. CV2]|uniref:hypothetical protein n=1 Tax=Cupriavidus ulmosensis TaxID=3065913 RepID=UPI00296B3C29|nr:hypothetical protein [Cupriavidus sp. CV2]MDW3682075.1 hypothetical protein [Cupriavidus sp. CV2]